MSVRRGVSALVVLTLSGCVTVPAPPEEPPPAPVPAGIPVSFEFARLDGGVLRSAELLGRPTVVLFAATYDTPSQAAARIAAAVVRRHRPRVNGLAIVLEPPENRPIAEAFAAALDLPFPAVSADPKTLSAEGSFPGIRHVPSIVLLDREGREVWRRVGLANVEVLEAALREHLR